MAKHKSPGQKRKGIVRIVAVVLFLVSTFCASLIAEKMHTSELSWVKNHNSTSAKVTDLTQEEEEYRNLKGRTRHRDVYYVSYEFAAADEQYTNDVSISHSQFSALAIGDNIEIWYDQDDPNSNDTKANIESEIANNNTLGNMISVVPYTGPAILFIYYLLTLIFVRESKHVLPEGFYTENSWLDIDDKYVVALENGELIYFSINDKQADAVQSAYQENAPLEELIRLGRAKKVARIPLAEISELTSDHNSDVFSLEHNNKTHSVEFLNQTVKAHALQAVKQQLPPALQYEKIEKSRLQSALPALIFLAVLAGGAFYMDAFLVWLIVGFIAVIWVLPKIFSRLIDPTVREQWTTPEAAKAEAGA